MPFISSSCSTTGPILLIRPDHDGISSSSIPKVSFLINEDIDGSSCASFINPRSLPQTMNYQCPQPSLLIITWSPETNKVAPKYLLSLFHAQIFKALACFENFTLFIDNGRPAGTRAEAMKLSITASRQKETSFQAIARPAEALQSSTMGVLTATTLMYAIGA